MYPVVNDIFICVIKTGTMRLVQFYTKDLSCKGNKFYLQQQCFVSQVTSLLVPLSYTPQHKRCKAFQLPDLSVRGNNPAWHRSRSMRTNFDHGKIPHILEWCHFVHSRVLGPKRRLSTRVYWKQLWHLKVAYLGLKIIIKNNDLLHGLR